MKEGGFEKRFIVDKKPNKKDSLEGMENDLYTFGYERMHETLERMKPFFEHFFHRVTTEHPDYIVFLDKGARPFALPFKKYLNDIHMEKPPEILFWNDSKYKEFSDSDKAQESIDDYLYYSRNDENFLKKKFFVVDETYNHGRGAKLLKEFFDKNHVDGNYFAFSHFNEGAENFQENFSNDNRFTLYDQYEEPGFFTKAVADTYIADGPFSKTRRRFEYKDTHDEYGQPQSELQEMKNLSIEVKKESDKAIYNTLKEIGPTDLKKDYSNINSNFIRESMLGGQLHSDELLEKYPNADKYLKYIIVASGLLQPEAKEEYIESYLKKIENLKTKYSHKNLDDIKLALCTNFNNPEYILE